MAQHETHCLECRRGRTGLVLRAASTYIVCFTRYRWSSHLKYIWSLAAALRIIQEQPNSFASLFYRRSAGLIPCVSETRIV